MHSVGCDKSSHVTEPGLFETHHNECISVVGCDRWCKWVQKDAPSSDEVDKSTTSKVLAQQIIIINHDQTCAATHGIYLCYCLLCLRGRKKTVQLSFYKIQDEKFGFFKILVAHPFASLLPMIAEHVQGVVQRTYSIPWLRLPTNISATRK